MVVVVVRRGASEPTVTLPAITEYRSFFAGNDRSVRARTLPRSVTRSATIIGAMGAGGIGLKLWESMRTHTNWPNIFYMVLLIIGIVFIFDTISNALRGRLIGRGPH